MPQILLTWREIKKADLPNYCFLCGRHGADLGWRRLEEVHIGYFGRTRRWVEVELPFCRRHFSSRLPGGGLWGRYGNAEFADHGVWVKGASQGFIDALREHRDKKYRRRDRRDDGGREEEERDPSTRPRRGDPAYERPPPSGCGTAAMVAAVACVVMFVACGLFAVGLVIPAMNAGPQKGGPPPPGFGPEKFGPPGPDRPRPGRRF